MSNNLPECPVCRKEVLIPLSAVYGETPKAFAHWICLRCGFYFGTGDTAGYNIPEDIKIAMLAQVVEKVRECSKAYEAAVNKGHFEPE